MWRASRSTVSQASRRAEKSSHSSYGRKCQCCRDVSVRFSIYSCTEESGQVVLPDMSRDVGGLLARPLVIGHFSECSSSHPHSVRDLRSFTCNHMLSKCCRSTQPQRCHYTCVGHVAHTFRARSIHYGKHLVVEEANREQQLLDQLSGHDSTRQMPPSSIMLSLQTALLSLLTDQMRPTFFIT